MIGGNLIYLPYAYALFSYYISQSTLDYTYLDPPSLSSFCIYNLVQIKYIIPCNLTTVGYRCGIMESRWMIEIDLTTNQYSELLLWYMVIRHIGLTLVIWILRHERHSSPRLWDFIYAPLSRRALGIYKR